MDAKGLYLEAYILSAFQAQFSSIAHCPWLPFSLGTFFKFPHVQYTAKLEFTNLSDTDTTDEIQPHNHLSLKTECMQT